MYRKGKLYRRTAHFDRKFPMEVEAEAEVEAGVGSNTPVPGVLDRRVVAGVGEVVAAAVQEGRR